MENINKNNHTISSKYESSQNKIICKSQRLKKGQKDKTEADIINLMTVDTENVLAFSWVLTRGITALVTIVICLYMLEI